MLGNLQVTPAVDQELVQQVRHFEEVWGDDCNHTHRFFLPRPGVDVGGVKSNCNQPQKLESDG